MNLMTSLISLMDGKKTKMFGLNSQLLNEKFSLMCFSERGYLEDEAQVSSGVFDDAGGEIWELRVGDFDLMSRSFGFDEPASEALEVLLEDLCFERRRCNDESRTSVLLTR